LATAEPDAMPVAVSYESSKMPSSLEDRGLAIIAPPPNPMMAMPVARPGRSGNHLISVETGEMYPMPRPMPPMKP
jgi:hypothetical protein